MEQELQELANELVEVTRKLRQIRPGAGNYPQGITAAEMSALTGIHVASKYGDEPRPGLIADHLHITKSALSQTLKVLEEKGLVDRARLKGDSRGVLLTLTPAGQALVDEAFAARNLYLTKVVECVGEDDLRLVLEVFKKIIKFHEDNGMMSEDGAPCA